MYHLQVDTWCSSFCTRIVQKLVLTLWAVLTVDLSCGKKLCLVVLPTVFSSTFHRGEVGTGWDASVVVIAACFLTLDMIKS